MPQVNLFSTNRRSSIRIPVSEEQHRELTGLIDLIADGLQHGRRRESLNLILMRFVDYAIYHFGKDGELIEKHGYGDYLLQYKVEQQAFTRELDELRRKARLPNFVPDHSTVSAMKGIFNRHVASADRYLVRRPDNEGGNTTGSAARA